VNEQAQSVVQSIRIKSNPFKRWQTPCHSWSPLLWAGWRVRSPSRCCKRSFWYAMPPPRPRSWREWRRQCKRRNCL